MNIDRLAQVRDMILAHPDNFNMSDFFVVEDHNGNAVSYSLPNADEDDRLHEMAEHPCGTVACIAGWTAILDDPVSDHWDFNGAILLGLTARQALSLFYGRGGFVEGTLDHTWQIPLYKITASHAAAAITSLIETGEVTWPDELGKVHIELPSAYGAPSNTLLEMWISHDASLPG